jgi:hypothetical protein
MYVILGGKQSKFNSQLCILDRTLVLKLDICNTWALYCQDLFLPSDHDISTLPLQLGLEEGDQNSVDDLTYWAVRFHYELDIWFAGP